MPIVLHVNYVHLIANTFALFIFGYEVEELCHYKIIYLLVYIILGYEGNVISGIFIPNSLSVGASTSLSGLVGLYFFKLSFKMKEGIARIFSNIFFIIAALVGMFIGFFYDT